jgi:hypothetical protein
VTPEGAVVARIMADSGVSALVGTRVYLGVLPQKLATWPAIVVQAIDDPQTKHLRGPNALTMARVQVDCYSSELQTAVNPYTSVTAVSDAVTEALVYEPFTVTGRSVTGAERVDRRAVTEPDDVRRLVRMLQDFTVTSRPVS